MSLGREQVFELWVASASPWSAWVKPVLFAYLPEVDADLAGAEAEPPSAAWAPRADGSTILVIDLPGVRSVMLAEALVHRGYRPVPLFNGLPTSLVDPSLADPLVDVYPIAVAVRSASSRLLDPLTSLSAEAPPAFLLDSNRSFGRLPRPGAFDNRSVSLPTDFPSATFLQSRGVSRVVLVIESARMLSTAGQPAADLAHTLLRWQEAGLAIESCGVDETLALRSAPDRIEVERPKWFRAIWHNALITLGLRRNPIGGFGGELPVPGSSG